MKIILIGASGQLGRDLIKNPSKDIKLITPSKGQLDLSNPKECYKYILKNSPDWIINCGAYTNVDKAENYQELTQKVNSKGPESIAKAISKIGGKFLQISTDYVFDGNQNSPYKVDQKLSPINCYGISKANCEINLQNLLLENNQLCIIRTSWLMSPYGNNFATKMLELLNEREEIKVIYDQISSPTTTSSLAKVIWEIINCNNEYTKKGALFPKILHFSNCGIASWYDVAIAIKEIGTKKGLIKKNCSIFPIESKDYPTAAKRPHYSVLDSNETQKLINFRNMHWREALKKAFDDYVHQ